MYDQDGNICAASGRNYLHLLITNERSPTLVCRHQTLRRPLHFAAVFAGHVRPRRHHSVTSGAELPESAPSHGCVPILPLPPVNFLCVVLHYAAPQVMYDQDGNIVLRQARNYLGALTEVERVDRNGRPLPGASDAELAVMQVR